MELYRLKIPVQTCLAFAETLPVPVLELWVLSLQMDLSRLFTTAPRLFRHPQPQTSHDIARARSTWPYSFKTVKDFLGARRKEQLFFKRRFDHVSMA